MTGVNPEQALRLAESDSPVHFLQESLRSLSAAEQAACLKDLQTATLKVLSAMFSEAVLDLQEIRNRQGDVAYLAGLQLRWESQGDITAAANRLREGVMALLQRARKRINPLLVRPCSWYEPVDKEVFSLFRDIKNNAENPILSFLMNPNQQKVFTYLKNLEGDYSRLNEEAIHQSFQKVQGLPALQKALLQMGLDLRLVQEGANDAQVVAAFVAYRLTRDPKNRNTPKEKMPSSRELMRHLRGLRGEKRRFSRKAVELAFHDLPPLTMESVLYGAKILRPDADGSWTLKKNPILDRKIDTSLYGQTVTLVEQWDDALNSNKEDYHFQILAHALMGSQHGEWVAQYRKPPRFSSKRTQQALIRWAMDHPLPSVEAFQSSGRKAASEIFRECRQADASHWESYLETALDYGLREAHRWMDLLIENSYSDKEQSLVYLEDAAFSIPLPEDFSPDIP